MKEKDEGCILRLFPLGEHGLIVCWCSARHGILRTVARQARKPGSDFFGRLDLFHECEFLYSLPSKGELGALHSAALLDPRLPLRSRLSRLRLASYVARLLLATVEPGDEEPAWHTLISGALDYIASSEPRRAILYHFEKRLAALHGLYIPSMTPYSSLLQHFQHLPAGREELLRSLS